MGMQEEAEARYGHPIQYALVGNTYIGDTEDVDDITVRQRAGFSTTSTGGPTIERYNRCPTCEQWSPCDRRR
jgi:hypothetical protein